MRWIAVLPARPALVTAFLLLLAGCTATRPLGEAGNAGLGAILQPAEDSGNAVTRRYGGTDPATAGGWVCPVEELTPRHRPTLYVAADGSDDNDGRSAERPLKTLQRAADLVRPGDVVWVRGGVHSSDVEFTTSGTEENPIVFESHPGECAVLDGSTVAGARRVTFDGVRNMVFRNFVVRNSPAEGIYLVDSHHNVLSNLRIHDNFYSGITSVKGDGNLFSYVISHGNADARGGDADGISISSGDRNRIQYCVTYGNSDDGVDTWRSTRTLVERCVSFRNGREGGDGNGFKAGGGNATVDTVVRYSIAFDNRSNGFDYNTGRRVTFDHNTSFGNGHWGFVATGANLRNNLSIDNGSGSWYGEIGAGQHSANSWQLGINGTVFAAVSNASPNFLGLSKASRAVDAGVDLGTPFLGGAPDLGALEFGQTIDSSLRIDLPQVLNQ